MTASRISAFYWRDFVQPFVPVQVLVAGQVVRGVYTMAAQSDSQPIKKAPKKSPAELAAQRARKNATYHRNATRVNKHSEIGRTGEKSNSERAPR